MMPLTKQKRRFALLLITTGCLLIISISNVLSNNNYLLRSLSNSDIVNVDSLKVYEYPAPPGMTPEDLFQCFQKYRSDPTIDNPAIKVPYLPEDLGEWFLHKQMEEYPHKTDNPSEADIFIINAMPILSSEVKGKCHGMTHYDRQMKWIEILEESNHFKERPKDHAYLCTSWWCYRAVHLDMKRMIAPKTVLVMLEPVREWFHGFDSNFAKEIPIPPVVVTPYLSHSYIKPLDENDVTLVRPHQVTFIGNFHRNSRWRGPLNHPEVNSYLTSHNFGLGHVPDETEFLKGYAEAMSNSNFCLVPCGDTQSSRRLFDAMVAGCIPVFLGPKYPLPFEHIIPYSEFSVRFEDEWLVDASKQMKKLHEDYDQDMIVQMRKQLSKYIKYIDYRHGNGVLKGLIGAIDLRRKSASEPLSWIGERAFH